MADKPDQFQAAAGLYRTSSAEMIDQINAHLMDLEKEPREARRAELLRKIAMGYHNIKGSAGVLGLNGLIGLIHDLEELTVRMRRAAPKDDRRWFDLQFECLDAIAGEIQRPGEGRAPETTPFLDLRQKIRTLLDGPPGGNPPAGAPKRNGESAPPRPRLVRKGKAHGGA